MAKNKLNLTLGTKDTVRLPVVWYEWLYEVSNFWDIKSLLFWREKILKPGLSNKWYLDVWLYNKQHARKQFLVHRLKAVAFIPNPENKPFINHIDNDRSNNWYTLDGKDNLERCTQSENIKHSIRCGITTPPGLWVRWKFHPRSKKVGQYTKDWDFIKLWHCIKDIQRRLWFSCTAIIGCCKWRTKTSAGFIWRYV